MATVGLLLLTSVLLIVISVGIAYQRGDTEPDFRPERPVMIM
jgi:hypothetical protein